MTTLYVILLVAAHFLGDWIFQSRKMAVDKSNKLKTLFNHVLIVSCILFATACPFIGVINAAWAVTFNALSHILIDWYGWGFYKKKFVNKPLEFHFKNYWFYFTIACDQFLHLAIMFFLFLP